MSQAIVCGVDGSRAAEAALEVARRLSSLLGLRLVVAHVADQRQLEPIEIAPGPPDADHRVGVGLPADELAAIADEEGAELIVVGSRGRGTLKTALFGSVSGRLAEIARCPVVIVPSSAGEVTGGALRTTADCQASDPWPGGTSGCLAGSDRRKALANDLAGADIAATSLLLGPRPCDGPDAPEAAEDTRAVMVVCGVDEDDLAREVVRVAGALADRIGARLVLAHVAPSPVIPGVSAVPGAATEMRRVAVARARRRLEELSSLEDLDGRVEHRVVFGAPAASLAALTRRYAADLLVVGHRPRGRLASALLGRVSAHLAQSAPCPVVVVGTNAQLHHSAVSPDPSPTPGDGRLASGGPKQRRHGGRWGRDPAHSARA